MSRLLPITLIFTFLTVVQWNYAQTSCGGDQSDRKIAFSAVASKNQSGHIITKFSADNLSAKHSKIFSVDVRSEWICEGQRQGIRIGGALVAPPSPPEGYKLFPGIGFYKHHTEMLGFDDASKVCEDEGGHLAVPNSKEEGEILKNLVAKDQTYIGAHDRAIEGKFMTIFGMPLGDYIAWAPGQPDNSGGQENCVTIILSGKLNDVPCDHKTPFLCEFELI